MALDIDEETGLVRRPAPNPYPFGSSLLTDLVPERPDDPDRLALIDGDRTWNRLALSDDARRAAAVLHDLGVRPGDRVAWSLPNCAELPIGFLGTQLTGGVWLGINLPLAAPEKRFLLDDSGASVFVATREVLDEVGHTPGRRDVSFDEWGALVGRADPHAAPAIDHDPHAPAAIAYTSGTTGRPKGAVHSQHNLMWPGLVTVELHPPVAHDRQGTPLAHTILNMLVLGVVSAWVRGTTGVVLHSTHAAEFAAEVERHQVTRTTLVPTILHDLVHRPEIDPASLRSLESIIVGGAGTPAPLRRAFREKFGIRAISGYGLSEAPSGIVRESAEEDIDEVAAGYPLPLLGLRIVDDDDRPVAPGTEGEICVLPATTGAWAGSWTPTLGYWRRPESTRELLRGGALHTGDIGMLDTNGRLTISGRRSELILRGGANVYPVEVETVMANHPHVAEVAVYGVPDERLGQRVAASIVAAVDDPDLDDIRTHCAEHLAAYKIPAVIDVRPSLPRNAMGKVHKQALL
ncbi:MAG: AMP-binding protein [Acidimicrobiales bacterium]